MCQRQQYVLLVVCTLILVVSCAMSGPRHQTVTRRLTVEQFLADPSTTVDLVIARYKENLDWLKAVDISRFRRVIIYNKDDAVFKFESPTAKGNVQIVKLPNVGRCDHTYLHHIIENYDNNLATITVFLPGSCDIDYKKDRCNHAIMTAIEHGITTIPIGGPNDDFRKQLHDFHMDGYASAHPLNRQFDDALEVAQDRPFGVWYKKVFGDQPIRSIVWSGIFAASETQIKSRSKDFYIQMSHYLDKHSNPEVGHYVERAWATIFNVGQHGHRPAASAHAPAKI